MAIQPAVLGLARLGNFRLGYSAAMARINATKVSILIAGVEARARVREGSGFMIHDALNEEPNTCALTVDTAAPVDEQSLRVSINLDDPRLLFQGNFDAIDLSAEGFPPQPVWRCDAIDETAQANRRRPFGTWTNVSATTVAQEILADVAPWLSDAGIAAGLPNVSINLDGSEGLAGAMSQLARLIGGYWKVEDGVFYLFQTDASDPPDDIDDTPGRFLDDPPISIRTDTAQLLTRAYGKGHGEVTLSEVAAGATAIPITNADPWFNPSGGQVISDTQILAYTGIGMGYTPMVPPWTPEASPVALAWQGVAWSPALELFVAVAGDGTAQDVMTSPDGLTWTTRTPSVNAAWTAVAWSPALNLFVAVGASAVMTSPDGITWTTRTAAAANQWEGVAWAPALNLFVAVSQNGASRVMTSPDGITWTSRTAAAALQWQDVVWSPALALFAAVAITGPNSVMTSPDGITWTQRTTGTVGWAIAWAPALHLFVTVAGSCMSSPDGITWTTRTAASTNTWFSVVWAPEIGLFVAVSVDGTASPGDRSMTSADGITWIAVPTPVAGTWTSVAWAPSLGRLVAVGAAAGGIQIMTTAAPMYPILTGVTGIVVPLVEGAPVNIWVQRDDLAAQAAQAAIDTANGHTPADGIYEGPPIVDERRSEASLTALLDAHLARYAWPIQTVTYPCRDVKSKSGKPVHIDVTLPGGVHIGPVDLVIQQVDITEIDVAPGIPPKFSVTASSVTQSLEALLRKALAA